MLHTLRGSGLAWVVLWAGCNQIAGIYEGEPRACSNVEDCNLGAVACRVVECREGACVYIDAPEGMPIADQTPGDCQEIQCDGQGQARVVTISNDNDDGNPCTFDECVGTTPRHQLRPWVACYTGDPLTREQGICQDGKQACDANGELVGECVGEILPREETCLTIYDDDCDGQINEAGADCICTIGTKQPCYGSTVATHDVGPCKSGFQECIDGLAWGDCTLQVLPQPESCGTPEDDNCDGQMSEGGADCVCGDGIISNFEECDDGNTLDGDGCTSTCTLPTCGNGVQEADEQCDDGNEIDTGDCTRGCRIAGCGDGIVQNGVEICDDGNLINGDGCQGDCTPTPVMLALGYEHSCALFANGAVKCWGRNVTGELGLGDTVPHGDALGDMGKNLPVVDLGTNRKAKAIAAGYENTCAILDDGAVKCWGRNDYGQLGIDTKTFHGHAPNTMGDALPSVNLGEKAKAIAVGQYQVCAILESGAVKCWGDGTDGKLGLGSTSNWGDKTGDMAKLPVVPLSAGTTAISVVASYEHTCVVQSDLRVRCWGSGYCQLANGGYDVIGDNVGEMGDALALVNLGTEKAAFEAGVGTRHQCVLLSGGIVRCWGGNDVGQVGADIPCNALGDARPAVDLGAGIVVTRLAVGSSHTCVITSSGRVKCWGWNSGGQLGLGDLDNRGVGGVGMGQSLPVVQLW